MAESSAIKVLQNLLQIHKDKESIIQLQELCLKVDSGDAIILENIADDLVKESIEAIFSILHVRSYSANSLQKKYPDLSIPLKFKVAFIKSKHTPSFVQLFRAFLPDVLHKLTSETSAKSSEISFKAVGAVEEEPNAISESTKDFGYHHDPRSRSNVSSSLELNREDWLQETTQEQIRPEKFASMKKQIQSRFEFTEGGSLSVARSEQEKLIGPEAPQTSESSSSSLSVTTQQKSRKEQWAELRERGARKSSNAGMQRDEWMTSLPHPELQPTLQTVTNRKFSTKTKEPVRDEDRQGWISQPPKQS